MNETASIKRVRHPEKVNRPDNPIQRKPAWIRVKAPVSKTYNETRELMRGLNLTTVCEEAACPNIGECWAKKHATMMIMGEICTRACAFCNVSTGKPNALKDGGAQHFAEVITAIREATPETTIEILTPDFLKKPGALEVVVAAKPDVFNHNLETVPKLYPSVRPGARYYHSLRLLERVKELDPTMFTKSGLMVGLGEEREEVSQVMDDMRVANIDFITIGQYLQPTVKHHALHRFVTPDEFAVLEKQAYAKGFLMVSASPLTRSSHHAGEDFAKLKAARERTNGKN